jgi:quinol monooxygenase YgiN
VPSAPLQRILYQVYRDRAAYDEHLRRPYVADFTRRLRPLVLATNVIELGVRQAKVSALAGPPGRRP